MICPNCQFVETEDAGFCSKCGQKFGPAKLTITQFIADLIDHVFNLDTNFFHTIKKIFIPGQLTIDFFAGHRKRYYHPLRLFFFLMVIHLGVLGSLIPYDTVFEPVTNETNKVITKHKNKDIIASVAKTHKDRSSQMAIDSAIQWFKLYPDTAKVRNQKTKAEPSKTDSTKIIPPHADNPNPDFNPDPKNNGDDNFIDIFNLGKIPNEDIIMLSNDSLAKKYNLDQYWKRLAFRQVQKFYLDPKGLIGFILGNISWMMIVMIPILAVIMKLLFFRRKRYYIEHLFFLYHWHAFAFLFGTVLVLFFRNYLQFIYGPFVGLVIVFGFFGWKRYYKQGMIKSLIKFCMMGFSYFFLFIILMMLTGVISFGFF
jgi:Protein of unknown function (DUF3667)